MSESIAVRLAAVGARVEAASNRVGRPPESVFVVAVSKTWPADVCLGAVEAGVAALGENRAQEFRDKYSVLKDRVPWHFVGHLQTNKVRHVVGAATLVHSVDRYGLAEAIDKRARSLDIVQDVLVEVNVSGESTKNGIEPARAEDLIDQIAPLSGVALRGLMTMPPMTPDPEDSRPYFKELAAMRESIAERHPGLVELSMGMTRDFEVAIEEGATIVRIGEAIFGPRRPAP
ncbi:MAG TPA: YggS family pyridoxal phosphate-dependent enzyme [Actinomycetota bacterium]|jgi:pyridoxal phosphate enzyme (YggS family)|nr:YggS family pyridoxal phosphate-dependent enzyme [Actinomycetota bacterium]